MPHPRTARPAPDPEDDCSPEEFAALQAELKSRMDHHRAALARKRAARGLPPRPGYELPDADERPDLT
ncbi:hypothetical protein [Brevundimonas sp.]|uniref:hypothetical protein n=1 Tax=Brevundimonas sp. TaxID=1871086 RepID=UPI001D720839|nr:hypothetical protein [Brevundimonas sp.]MBL0946556.1 hypothetical protein [Brevundimonas sp.]